MDTVWIINTTVCTLSSLTAAILNVFFIYCLCCSKGDSLRQPMKKLLTWSVGSNVFYHSTTMLYTLYIVKFSLPPVVYLTVTLIYFFFCCVSLVSPSWLSIFYYFSIVPQTFRVMAWVKRNLGAVVFFCAIMDCSLVLLSTILMALYEVGALREAVSENLNMTISTVVGKERAALLNFSPTTVFIITHLQMNFWTMMFTWGGTFLYLRRHMKSMENMGSFSQPQQQSQMRVTIIGLVQALVFLPCCLWSTVTVLYQRTTLFDFPSILIYSLLGLVNSLCLGLSQSVFRQEAELLSKTAWNRLRCA